MLLLLLLLLLLLMRPCLFDVGSVCYRCKIRLLLLLLTQTIGTVASDEATSTHNNKLVGYVVRKFYHISSQRLESMIHLSYFYVIPGVDCNLLSKVIPIILFDQTHENETVTHNYEQYQNQNSQVLEQCGGNIGAAATYGVQKHIFEQGGQSDNRYV